MALPFILQLKQNWTSDLFSDLLFLPRICFFSLWPHIPCASTRPLKLFTSLPHLLCNFFSKMMFPFIFSCNFLLALLLPVSLPWDPMCTPRSSQPPAIFSPSSRLLSGPYNLLCVENSQTNISAHPFPQALFHRKLLLESTKLSLIQCFKTYYLQYPHRTTVFFNFADCISISPFPKAETLKSYLTQLFLNFCLCLLYGLYITTFCEFFFHSIP